MVIVPKSNALGHNQKKMFLIFTIYFTKLNKSGFNRGDTACSLSNEYFAANKPTCTHSSIPLFFSVKQAKVPPAKESPAPKNKFNFLVTRYQ